MYLAEYYIHIINHDSCKLFSRSSKLTHALLASKRRPFDLQKTPF